MDPKTISIALGAAAISAFGTGLLSSKNFGEMAGEVDRVRAAESKVAAEAGQYRETIPTEIGKAVDRSGLAGKRLVYKDPCRLDHGHAFCLLDGGRELQWTAADPAKIQVEIDAMAAEDAAKLAEELDKPPAVVEEPVGEVEKP